MPVYLTTMILFTVSIVLAVSSMATPVHVPSNNWKWKYCSKYNTCTCSCTYDNILLYNVLGDKINTLLNINYLFLKPYPLIIGKTYIFYFSYTKGIETHIEIHCTIAL